MKTIIPFSLIIIAISFCSEIYANTLSIRADEWFPINGVPNSDKPGYIIEMATAIMAKQGSQVDYKTMPWERSLDQVRKGHFDCVVGAYHEDAPDFMFPKLSWGKIGTSFYAKKGTQWRYEGISSLESVSLGAIGGYAYTDEFDSYVEQHKSSSKVQVINANNALEQNIKKLLAGRVDVIIESDLVMNAKMDEMGVTEQIDEVGVLLERKNMYIACSPARPEIAQNIEWLNNGLIELRQNGQLKTILKKYGLKDWHH